MGQLVHVLYSWTGNQGMEGATGTDSLVCEVAGGGGGGGAGGEVEQER